MLNYNTHLITLRRSYSIKDMALLLGIDQRTCHRWIKNEGLKVIEENARPFLIMGADLANFIKTKKAKAKIPLRDDEYFCLKCRKAVKSKAGSEKIIQTGKKIGKDNLEQVKKIGLCEVCGTKINRFLRGIKQRACFGEKH